MEKFRQRRRSERREELACDIGSYASDPGTGMMQGLKKKILLDSIQIEVVHFMQVIFYNGLYHRK